MKKSLTLLTHNEEEFDNNKKVSSALSPHEYDRSSPVIDKCWGCEDEEDDIDDLENDKDEVEIDELRSEEECRENWTVILPLVTPRITKEALGHPHARQDQVTGAIAVQQEYCHTQH